MNITPIRNDEDLRRALAAVSDLMEVEPDLGTPESDRLDVLTTLIEAYEEKHFPIGPPDPVEAIRFRMDQSGMTVKDLVPHIGHTNRVYEVLNGKRALTLRMIQNLHHQLGIPAEALIA